MDVFNLRLDVWVTKKAHFLSVHCIFTRIPLVSLSIYTVSPLVLALCLWMHITHAHILDAHRGLLRNHYLNVLKPMYRCTDVVLARRIMGLEDLHGRKISRKVLFTLLQFLLFSKVNLPG